MHTSPLETTLENGGNYEKGPRDESTIPQRCLVALIDVNRLKVHMSQFRTSVIKEVQKLQSVLAILSDAYQGAVVQMKQKIQAIGETRCHSQGVDRLESMIQQREVRIVELATKIQQMQLQKDKAYGLLKRQSQTISKTKMQHQVQISRLNLRVNQLYSIIHQKSTAIDVLTVENAMTKQTLRGLNTDGKAQRTDDIQQRFSTARLESRSDFCQSRVKSIHNLDDRRTNRNEKSCISPELHSRKASIKAPLRDVNFSLDPQIMQRISNLVGSITTGDQAQKAKQNAVTRTQVKQAEPRTYRDREQIRSSQHKTPPLNSLFKSAIKGCMQNHRLFK